MAHCGCGRAACNSATGSCSGRILQHRRPPTGVRAIGKCVVVQAQRQVPAAVAAVVDLQPRRCREAPGSVQSVCSAGQAIGAAGCGAAELVLHIAQLRRAQRHMSTRRCR